MYMNGPQLWDVPEETQLAANTQMPCVLANPKQTHSTNREAWSSALQSMS